jgi:hypothetical protein
MSKIFVFGSNRLGIHGAGSALYARMNHGAINGQGEGLQGNSYAIPTKATPYRRLNLEQIRDHVNRFVEFAVANPQMEFYVTRIGCGMAGYTDKEIAPYFASASSNVELPSEWQQPGIIQTEGNQEGKY